MPLEWNFWYPLWMIQDGLPNRRVGDQFSWDIEFYSPAKLSHSEQRRKTTIPLSDYQYRVIGEITSIYQTASIAESACVIDIGLKVIGDPESLPVASKPGDYVCGEMNLGLSHGHAVPPRESPASLKREWRVNAIQADITPYISLPDRPDYFVRDKSRICYKTVWSTADVQAENYILHCSVVL
jgi:hypothetical protein